jgi:hypothetical protein
MDMVVPRTENAKCKHQYPVPVQQLVDDKHSLLDTPTATALAANCKTESLNNNILLTIIAFLYYQ